MKPVRIALASAIALVSVTGIAAATTMSRHETPIPTSAPDCGRGSAQRYTDPDAPSRPLWVYGDGTKVTFRGDRFYCPGALRRASDPSDDERWTGQDWVSKSEYRGVDTGTQGSCMLHWENNTWVARNDCGR